jgi:hypothetical protein
MLKERNREGMKSLFLALVRAVTETRPLNTTRMSVRHHVLKSQQDRHLLKTTPTVI